MSLYIITRLDLSDFHVSTESFTTLDQALAHCKSNYGLTDECINEHGPMTSGYCLDWWVDDCGATHNLYITKVDI